MCSQQSFNHNPSDGTWVGLFWHCKEPWGDRRIRVADKTVSQGHGAGVYMADNTWYFVDLTITGGTNATVSVSTTNYVGDSGAVLVGQETVTTDGLATTGTLTHFAVGGSQEVTTTDVDEVTIEALH